MVGPASAASATLRRRSGGRAGSYNACQRALTTRHRVTADNGRVNSLKGAL
jgi:hypothetical protein